MCAGLSQLLFVNLTQTRVNQEEETSTEELPPTDQPGSLSMCGEGGREGGFFD